MSDQEPLTDESTPEGRPDGNEVDWAGLWDEVGFRQDQVVSLTQMRLAVGVSDHTGNNAEADAEELAVEAQEAGLLVVEKTVGHFRGEEAGIIRRGWKLSQEARR